ncbi:MAG: hypothetical protein H5T64_09280 [Chloroflexi bacterium]|nr:hypothetical protein [Chloroflexota bacterium]
MPLSSKTQTRATSHSHKETTPSPLRWLCLAVVSLVSLFTACSNITQPTNFVNPAATKFIEGATPTWAPLLLTPPPTKMPSPTYPPNAVPLTPTFGLPAPQPTCEATPQWGLGDVWANEPVRTRLGCPTGEQMGEQGAQINFEHGLMLWRPDKGLIYVLYYDHQLGRRWEAWADTYLPGDPDMDPSITPPTPEAGRYLYQPTGRFGKLWRSQPNLRERLGWAVKESGQESDSLIKTFSGALQDFAGGLIYWNGAVSFVLRTDDMTWDLY